MSKKDLVITDTFNHCQEKKNYVFHNSLVKDICKKHGFGNPFDATKMDDTSKLPRVLLENNYFLLQLQVLVREITNL